MKLLSTLTLALGLFSFASSAALKVGDMAPEFSMVGSDGKTYTLSDYKGKKAVVLAWFPKAFTSGCTVECKSLAENGDKLKRFNAEYFMASTDKAEKNTEFANEMKADFPLLSDPDAVAAKAYDVNLFGFAKRHTFYIDKTGKIVMIDKNVRPKTSAEDMAKYMAMLKFDQ